MSVRHWVVAVLIGGGISAPAQVESQTLEDPTATPEAAAELFLRSVRAIRWSAAAQIMDDSALDRIRSLVYAMADADSTGRISQYLTGTDAPGLRALAPSDVFTRTFGVLIDDMPGLMHALYDRDDQVIGHVLEGADSAHVVYRTTARISGAVSEVKIVQLRHSAEGWRVLWSDELETLDAALRGVPLRGR